MKFSHFLKEDRQKPIMGVWYHGDQNKRQNFRDQKMQRDLSTQEGNDEGPGIYLTRSKKEANRYAYPNGFVYTVTVHSRKFIWDKYTPSPTEKYETLENLIDWAPEERQEIGLSNWAEDPQEAKETALEQYMRWPYHNACVAIYEDFYGESEANEWANSMVANDIDGYWKWLDEHEHLVVYNPKIIQIEEEDPYDEV